MTGPAVADHSNGAELAWVARGWPFTRPVLARSSVGVRQLPVPGVAYGPFVRVEIMAGGLAGQDASAYPWFTGLEWLGPVLIPGC